MTRLFATALWLAVTVASTAMVWAATSIVAADVTDRPTSVLAHREVVSELAASSATTTTSTTPTAGSATSTVPTPGRGTAPVSPTPAVTSAPRSQTPQPGVTTAPLSPPITAATATGPSPNPPAASPPTTQPSPSQTATYSTSGGVVRVACNGFFIELISAIPSNGYAVKVVAAGPGNVEVHFLGSGQDLSVKAVCFGQPIRYYDQYPPRQERGSS